MAANFDFKTNNWTFGLNPGNFALNWGAIGTGAEMYASLGLRFSANIIPQWTEFANLFDQYSIRKVVVRLQPWSNSSEVNPGGNLYHSTSPLVDYRIDHDDFTAYTADVAGVNQMRETNNHKSTRLFKTLAIPILPRASGMVFDNANLPAPATVIRPKWLDVAENNIPHYGLKMIFSGINPGAAGSFCMRATATFYIKFKGPR